MGLSSMRFKDKGAEPSGPNFCFDMDPKIGQLGTRFH